MLFQSLLYNDI